MNLQLEGLIPIVGGIYGLLIVYRKVRISKNSDANELWIRKFGTMMKIICPLMILFGLAEFVGLFH